MFRETKHKKEMKIFYEELETVRKLNTGCEKCAGTGIKVQRASDCGTHFEEIECSACNGTGIKKEK